MLFSKKLPALRIEDKPITCVDYAMIPALKMTSSIQKGDSVHMTLETTEPAPEGELHGGRVNYYLIRVDHPQREDQPPYTAECEDLIEAAEMTPDEANIFKEIWRSANARKGKKKQGHNPLYGAQKVVHYAKRLLLKRQRENPSIID